MIIERLFFHFLHNLCLITKKLISSFFGFGMIRLQNPSSITFDQTFFGREFFKRCASNIFSRNRFSNQATGGKKRGAKSCCRGHSGFFCWLFLLYFFEHNCLLLRYCCFSAHQKTQPRRKFQIYGRTGGVQIPWELYLAVFLFRVHLSAELDFAGTHLHQFSAQWA